MTNKNTNGLQELMDNVKQIFGNQFTLGNLLILIFVAGGFYYVTPQQIEQNSNDLEAHIIRSDEALTSLAERAVDNRIRIRKLEQTYAPAEKLNQYVQRSDLESLERLMREIQKNQNARLDYIISRMDDGPK